VKKTSGTTTSLYPFGDDYEITNGVVTKYISIEGVGVVAKKVTGGSSPGVYWFLSDHLGSLQGVLDGNGAAISRRTYRPYGQTLGQSGSHTESRGWIDQRNDTETGLTYLHARYFDPQLGTFLSADPMDPTVPGVAARARGRSTHRSFALRTPSRKIVVGGRAEGLALGRTAAKPHASPVIPTATHPRASPETPAAANPRSANPETQPVLQRLGARRVIPAAVPRLRPGRPKHALDHMRSLRSARGQPLERRS
jgi:RHS repeat-associated protein